MFLPLQCILEIALPIESSYVIRYDFIYYALLKFQMLQGYIYFTSKMKEQKYFLLVQ